MDEDAQDIDVAAAMGFGGFGAQPQNKRRKFNSNDSFVDPALVAHTTPSANSIPEQSRTGSNAFPIGKRKVHDTQSRVAVGSESEPAPTEPPPSVESKFQDQDESKTNLDSVAAARDELSYRGREMKTEVANKVPTREMLRHGVRNARGDLAFSLPSFIEDPWEGLKAENAG